MFDGLFENEKFMELKERKQKQDDIKDTIFFAKDGFFESKRMETYIKKREKELLDFISEELFEDIPQDLLPPSIACVPITLLAMECTELEDDDLKSLYFIDFDIEEIRKAENNIKILKEQDIYVDEYILYFQDFWRSLCYSWLKARCIYDDVNESNFVRFAAFEETRTYYFILHLCIHHTMRFLLNLKEEEGSIKDMQAYERCMDGYKRAKEEIEELQREVKELRTQNQIYQKKVAALQEGTSKTEDTAALKENQKLRGQIRRLSAEAEKINEKNQFLVQENKTLLEEIKWRNQQVDKASGEDIFYEGRYLFVGGHYSVVDNLKELFPNAKFILKETESVSASTFYKLDAVIYLSKFMNHCMYNNIRNQCQRLGIKQYHISKTGTDAILQEMKGL